MIDFTVFEKKKIKINKTLKLYRRVTNIELKKKKKIPLKLNNVCSCNE